MKEIREVSARVAHLITKDGAVAAYHEAKEQLLARQQAIAKQCQHEWNHTWKAMTTATGPRAACNMAKEHLLPKRASLPASCREWQLLSRRKSDAHDTKV